MNTFLVIGYGNTLRHDDGVGPWVAQRVAALFGSKVRSVAVHQLVPELAEFIAEATCVIFVDALQGTNAFTVKVMEDVGDERREGSHVCHPTALLAMTERLYGVKPRAWLATVPAGDFSYGEGLSPQAEDGAAAAVLWIAEEYERWVYHIAQGEAQRNPGVEGP